MYRFGVQGLKQLAVLGLGSRDPLCLGLLGAKVQIGLGFRALGFIDRFRAEGLDQGRVEHLGGFIGLGLEILDEPRSSFFLKRTYVRTAGLGVYVRGLGKASGSFRLQRFYGFRV